MEHPLGNKNKYLFISDRIIDLYIFVTRDLIFNNRTINLSVTQWKIGDTFLKSVKCLL